jgi:hypothetical protein
MKDKEMETRADNFSDERIIQNFEKNPCALFYFTFPDWNNDAEKAEYNKWKTASQNDFKEELKGAQQMEKMMKKTNRAEIGIGRIALHFKDRWNISYGEIGKICGYSDEAVRGYVELFEEGVVEGGIDVSTLPKKYFDDVVLQRIKDKHLIKPSL